MQKIPYQLNLSEIKLSDQKLNICKCENLKQKNHQLLIQSMLTISFINPANERQTTLFQKRSKTLLKNCLKVIFK
jgi:hypothetical protein